MALTLPTQERAPVSTVVPAGRETPAAQLCVDGQVLRMVDVEGSFGPGYSRLPIVLRLLAENVLRNTKGEERNQAVEALHGWLESGTSAAEIGFLPTRV